MSAWRRLSGPFPAVRRRVWTRASRRFVGRFTLREADGGVRKRGPAGGETVFSPVEDSPRRVVRRGLRAPCGHGSEGCRGSSLPGRFQGPAGRRTGMVSRNAAASAPHFGKATLKALEESLPGRCDFMDPPPRLRHRRLEPRGRPSPRENRTARCQARTRGRGRGSKPAARQTGAGVVWRLLRRRVRSDLPADRNRGYPRTRRLMIPELRFSKVCEERLEQDRLSSNRSKA